MTISRLVFLVDGDSSARSGLARLLLTAGHDVRAFVSSEEFLEAFDPELVGCLLLDSRTAGFPVDELQAEFAKRGVRLPMIVVSADDDSKTRLAAHRLNAAAFFRKPVDGSALLDAIDWAVRRNLENHNTDANEHADSGATRLKSLIGDHNEHTD